MKQNLARFDIPGGDHYSSLAFDLTHCPGEAFLCIRMVMLVITMMLVTMTAVWIIRWC